jgi:hypothetical protein
MYAGMAVASWNRNPSAVQLGAVEIRAAMFLLLRLQFRGMF